MITNKDIIDSWNRDRYPSFIDYLNSKEYKEKFSEEIRENLEEESKEEN